MLAYWTHNLDPFVIKFPPHWPIPGIRWYGVAYLLGFLSAYFWLQQGYAHGKIKLSPSQQQGFLFACFCGILIGGRLGYVLFYQWEYYRLHPLEIFSIWEGGMSAHGGFLGIFFSLFLWGHRHHVSVFSLTDLTIPCGTLGIFFGRCANFINGELYGTCSQLPWAVIFPPDAIPRHPSQIYEALGEGLLLFLWSCQTIRKKSFIRTHPGVFSGCFLIYYGIIRYVMEYFREPDAPFIAIFSRGQFYSIGMIAIGVLFTYLLQKYPPKGCVFL